MRAQMTKRGEEGHATYMARSKNSITPPIRKKPPIQRKGGSKGPLPVSISGARTTGSKAAKQQGNKGRTGAYPPPEQKATPISVGR